MIINKELKSKVIRYSGRSSDFIFPTILQGCFGKCNYCYAARHNPSDFYSNIKVSNNLDELINLVKNYDVKDIIKPNQTHGKYITWDIACNSDIVAALHSIDYYKLVNYFVESDRDFGTFATKFVNKQLLKYDAENKMRVRMSLMPDLLSKVIEPNTAAISHRVQFLNKLIKSNYEVHINFSPVIFYKTWEEDYIKLFKFIDATITDRVKEQLACEVIFLTHNKHLHDYNLDLQVKGENLLWNSSIQEKKISKFGGNNIRYKVELKRQMIKKFESMLKEFLPYCKIRYIF